MTYSLSFAPLLRLVAFAVALWRLIVPFLERRIVRLIAYGAAFALVLLLLVPTLGLADLPAKASPGFVLPYAQLWALIVGLLTPLIGYVVNSKLWQNAPEPYKAFVQLAISAVATAIYTACATNVIGWNDATLQLLVTGILGSFSAHGLLWKPSGVAARLRGETPKALA